MWSPALQPRPEDGPMPSQKPDDDTSITLMMRLRRAPADVQAWDEFVRRYQPMIRDWCVRWGSQPDDAEDVAQEVLLKLLAAMRTFEFDPGRSFRGWLKTVTQNAWTDFRRSHRRESTEDPERFRAILDSRAALDDLRSRMEDAFDRELLDLAMRRVEKRVKPANWRAFQLTAIDGRPGAEAARELSLPVARVFIAKHRVQRMLEEEIRIVKDEG
jgi:RNA polymerase sigma-70 factor (ECF subfamily)